jgi:hypothetical protein
MPTLYRLGCFRDDIIFLVSQLFFLVKYQNGLFLLDLHLSTLDLPG